MFSMRGTPRLGSHDALCVISLGGGVGMSRFRCRSRITSFVAKFFWSTRCELRFSCAVTAIVQRSFCLTKLPHSAIMIFGSCLPSSRWACQSLHCEPAVTGMSLVAARSPHPPPAHPPLTSRLISFIYKMRRISSIWEIDFVIFFV